MGRAETAFNKGLEALGQSRHADYRSEYIGDHEDAVAAFDEATRLDPDHLEAWRLKAQALDVLGAHERAAAAYAEVVRLAPDDLEARFGRGEALAALGRHEDAVAACDELLSRAPDHPGARHRRMLALARAGRHQDALAASETLLSDSPLSKDSVDARDRGSLRETTYEARLCRAASLASLGRSGEARAGFADVFARSWAGGR